MGELPEEMIGITKVIDETTARELYELFKNEGEREAQG
jgi:hypothetical protein